MESKLRPPVLAIKCSGISLQYMYQVLLVFIGCWGEMMVAAGFNSQIDK